HMRILASGSNLTISRTASMPPMSGITMSIVTRSGLSSLYLATACTPLSASPTTSKPACATMSPLIVRMTMASAKARTVCLTHPPAAALAPRRLPRLAHRPPPLHHPHQGPPHVYEPRHRPGRSGDSGGFEPRQDFANHRRLGGPGETPDAEQEQSDDAGVTHPMRRTQDTATGCVQQANPGPPLLPQ